MRADAELLDAIADGDAEALRELYDRHGRWLLLRLQRRCRDAGVVEDALQDTFLKVWRKAGAYRGQGSAEGWLWRIAVRCLLDRVRRRHPTPMEVLPHRRETVVSAEEQLLGGLEHGDLGAALERISPELRAVLQATVLDGLTVREASRLLGIPPGTVKTRAMRARARLREELS